MDAMLAEALELMMLGMGIVFGFLVLLVFSTTLMSLIINRYFQEPAAEVLSPALHRTPGSADIPDPHILAAIEAAIAEHRKRRC